jgi:PEP-CTERM motif
MQIRLWIISVCVFAVVAALVPAAAQAITFDFEDIAPGTVISDATPLVDTVGGLTATFTGSASVCASGGQFVSLTGNIEVQELCTGGVQSGPLQISFSSDQSSVSFDFATVEIVLGTPGTLTVQAFENATLVTISVFNSTVLPGNPGGEGLASITATFNRLVLTGDTSDTLLAIDNINTPAVPEPASFALLGTGLAGLVLARRRRNPA